MLKIKFLAVSGLVAALANLANPVSAQSLRNIDGRDYTIKGDSLTGIDQRTANDDFPVFFTNQPSGTTQVNNVDRNTTKSNFFRIGNEYTPIFLEPAQQNVYGNDGLQLKFDLTNTDERQDSNRSK